jgi:hypothetical protein
LHLSCLMLTPMGWGHLAQGRGPRDKKRSIGAIVELLAGETDTEGGAGGFEEAGHRKR